MKPAGGLFHHRLLGVFKSVTLPLICIQSVRTVSTPLGGAPTESIDIQWSECLI